MKFGTKAEREAAEALEAAERIAQEAGVFYLKNTTVKRVINDTYIELDDFIWPEPSDGGIADVSRCERDETAVAMGVPAPTPPQACGAHGVCNTNGTCDCVHGYSGDRVAPWSDGKPANFRCEKMAWSPFMLRVRPVVHLWGENS